MSASRTPSAPEFFGGGPADGERRPVDDGATAAVVAAGDDATPDGPSSEPGHLYERQPDGRFRYAGLAEPEPSHADGRAHALAALGHDRGPHPAMVLLFVVVLAVVMYAFAVNA